MLVGAFSTMSDDIFSIMNLFNIDVGDELDKYYNINKDIAAPGLDDKGEPIFYPFTGKSYLTGNYRLSRTDIEKVTVLVNDIRQIQIGDLIIRYDVAGEPVWFQNHI